MNLFPNAWHIARREYLTRVRSRTFVVVTVLLALLGIAVAMLPVVGRLIGGDQTVAIAVHADDGELESTTVATLKLILNAGDGGTTYKVTGATDAAAAASEVRSGRIKGRIGGSP